jgi:CSLREA domain-containing protein
MTNRRLIVLFGFTCVLILISLSHANAATITVNTLADEAGSGANCSLREAMIAAGTNTAFGGCVAGGAEDDIIVQVTGTLNLTSPLPDITRGVNINGGGADLFTVAGNNTFRLLNILMTVPETVVLNGISFTGGRRAAGTNAAAVEFNNNGTLSLSSCDFYANSGPSNGAADGSSVIFTNASASLLIGGTTFRNNPVEHVIWIGNTPFTMVNSTVSNNTGSGAGIFVFGGMPAGTITNSTIANNNQGIWHANTSGTSAITLKNSIVAQNSINIRRTGNNACPGVVNGVNSAGRNIFDNDPSGGNGICTPDATDLLNTNPQLAPIADYGGGVQTRNLLPNSPARDKITGTAPANFPSADQRGAARPLYGSADIGAVEFTSYVNNLSINGDFSLREAIASSPVNAPITFDAAFFATPRTLTMPNALIIDKAVRINGPGANLLTIAGDGTFRLLTIDSNSPQAVQLNDLSFTGGKKGAGNNSSVVEINDGDGPLEINRCEFFDNGTVGSPSPVLFTNLAKKITINGSTFRNNLTGSHTLEIGTTAVDIVNSTLSANTGTGGAVFVFGCNAVVNVTSSTVTGHSQGIWNACSDVSLPSVVNVKNTLLSQNGNINIRRTGGVPTANIINTLGNNLLDDNSGSQFANSDATDRLGTGMDPQLAPLAYYGGGTQTHALKAGSAALNFGTAAGVPATDQRGSTRVIGGAADIGAFERNITFDQTTLPNGRAGASYNNGVPFQLSATRQASRAMEKGAGEYVASILAPTAFELVTAPGQGLPPGLTLASNGQISGTPGAPGTYTFTVRAVDTDGMAGVAQFSMLIVAPTAASVSVSGKITDHEGRPVSRAVVTIIDPLSGLRLALTNSFGYYRFEDIPVGRSYVIEIAAKGYTFAPGLIAVNEEVNELNFTANSTGRQQRR